MSTTTQDLTDAADESMDKVAGVIQSSMLSVREAYADAIIEAIWDTWSARLAAEDGITSDWDLNRPATNADAKQLAREAILEVLNR
jgi:hypothetical protein